MLRGPKRLRHFCKLTIPVAFEFFSVGLIFATSIGTASSSKDYSISQSFKSLSMRTATKSAGSLPLFTHA